MASSKERWRRSRSISGVPGTGGRNLVANNGARRAPEKEFASESIKLAKHKPPYRVDSSCPTDRSCSGTVRAFTWVR